MFKYFFDSVIINEMLALCAIAVKQKEEFFFGEANMQIRRNDN